VRQSYGSAKGLLIIPGGFLSEGEMPEEALEREIYEETRIVARAKKLVSIRFSKKDWWAIFTAEYISGEPVSDCDENSEALFLDIESALQREDLTYTTKEILKDLSTRNGFAPLDFCPNGVDQSGYRLYC
jgi:ADP-ribose pyrophosphatase YjhB (NUDIX family)